MLVLTRRVGESVVIGDEVVVTVLEVKGDVVRVGVQAPRAVRVHRAEVYAAVKEANRAAAGGRGSAVEEELRRLAAQRTGGDGARRRGRAAVPGARGAVVGTPTRQGGRPGEPAGSAPDEPLQGDPDGH